MGAKEDLTGRRFGRWTVIEPSEKRGHHRIWKCQCDCGTVKDVYETNLKCGKTLSCGCLVKEVNSTHGDYDSRLYGIWASMLDRCKPNHHGSKNHGDRGITVCKEWKNSFEAFKEWAISNGYDSNAERGQCTIDRIDNDGNYEPSNCRWVNNKTQCRNKRNNRILTYKGESHCVAEWAEIIGISPNTIYTRLFNGWSVESALGTPVM